jgi:hypothetical protein
MIITTLLQSVQHGKKRWVTSLVIAALATMSGRDLAIANPTVLANNSTQLTVTPTTNGVYLYGESDQPDVVGKEYIIFETIGNKTIGAFYLPRSEFSCFYGKFTGTRLNVTLIDSFDLKQYKFALALGENTLTASKQPMMGEPSYQPLTKISINDRQILNTCKQQLQNPN